MCQYFSQELKYNSLGNSLLYFSYRAHNAEIMSDVFPKWHKIQWKHKSFVSFCFCISLRRHFVFNISQRKIHIRRHLSWRCSDWKGEPVHSYIAECPRGHISAVMTAVKSQRNSIVQSAGSISRSPVMFSLLMLPRRNNAPHMSRVNRKWER